MSQKKANSSLALAEMLARVAEESKGEEIRILYVAELLYITDYFVLVTSGSARQTKALAMSMQAEAKKETGSKGMVEGMAKSRWWLCDFGSVVVHILDTESREFYALDDLWADAGEVPFVAA